MTACNHAALELLPARKRALRCRRCHLTLSAEEAAAGYCPECWDRTGKRHDDLEELSFSEEDQAAYRCEGCGVIIRCG